MLEFGLHQGTSLYGRTPQDGLRLIPVAGSPGGTGLQVLWDICTHLQALGYPTVVLDGSERETAEAPGLLELLDDTLWIDPPTQLPGADSLAVLPAARGLAEKYVRLLDVLCGTPDAPLHAARAALGGEELRKEESDFLRSVQSVSEDF